MIHLGNKVNTVAEQYFRDEKKRPLVSELLRIVETENSKRKKSSARQQKAREEKQVRVEQEAQQEIKVIRERKKKAAKPGKQTKVVKPKPVLKVGDRVRLQDGKAVGSIDSLERNKAVVNYGQFTTNVSVDQLELVEGKSN